MGLFDGLFNDGPNRWEAAQNEVLQKLSACPMLDRLIESVLSECENEPWLQMAQSYYDSRERTVKIEPDKFEIKWSSTHNEPYIGNDGKRYEQKVEDVHGRIAYGFTESGYLPLHGYSYSYDNGKSVTVDTDTVCRLFASIVQERMEAKMPNCVFGPASHDKSFTYYVPALTFKDWF